MIRVVITGMGWVTSLGLDTRKTWDAMLAGASGIRPLRSLAMPGEAVQIAAEVDLPPDGPGNPHASRCEHLAHQALSEALQQAHLNLDTGDPRRRGVFQGASTAGLPAGEQHLLETRAGLAGQARTVLHQHASRITDVLAHRLNATGPRLTVMNACSSSLLSLGQAWERIASGELDFALAGGVEALCRLTFAGFSSLKVMDPRPCRPFNRDRAGMNLGEGAALFLLEPLEQARARRAEILAEVLGYGVAMDAHHPTAPHPEGAGAAQAMDMALQRAGLYRGEVDLISAHGTATPANDASEILAIKRVLGPEALRTSITASKSQFGHTLGAAGALGAATAILALRHQVVSPTLRLENPDPQCDLDCTPLVPRERSVRTALVNAFGFGGNNVCLALKRWEGK